MIHAIIDTNVLVAAAITHNPNSPTVRIVEHLLAGDIHIVYNAQIIREYEEVLSRPKFRIGYDKVTLLLDFVKRYGLTSLPKSYAGEMIHS